MSGKKVFLIGPGYVGREVLDRLIAEGYEVTTLIRSASAAPSLEEGGAKTRMGGLDDSETIIDQTYLSDIVINTASADHVGSVQATLAGVQKRADEGKPTIYLHTSGTGVLGEDSLNPATMEKVYVDDTAEMINSLPDSAIHRNVDLAIVNTGKELGDKAKLSIILPPLIYGFNPKYGRHSIQLPSMMRFALKNGYAGYMGTGEGIWGHVHVADLAQAYMVVLHWLESSSSEAVIENPYFFCEDGTESSWKDKAAVIGKGLHDAGKIKDPEPKPMPDDAAAELFGSAFITNLVIGTNSRSRGNRLRALGWTPKEKTVDRYLLEDEIPNIKNSA